MSNDSNVQFVHVKSYVYYLLELVEHTYRVFSQNYKNKQQFPQKKFLSFWDWVSFLNGYSDRDRLLLEVRYYEYMETALRRNCLEGIMNYSITRVLELMLLSTSINPYDVIRGVQEDVVVYREYAKLLEIISSLLMEIFIVINSNENSYLRFTNTVSKFYIFYPDIRNLSVCDNRKDINSKKLKNKKTLNDTITWVFVEEEKKYYNAFLKFIVAIDSAVTSNGLIMFNDVDGKTKKVFLLLSYLSLLFAFALKNKSVECSIDDLEIVGNLANNLLLYEFLENYFNKICMTSYDLIPFFVAVLSEMFGKGALVSVLKYCTDIDVLNLEDSTEKVLRETGITTVGQLISFIKRGRLSDVSGINRKIMQKISKAVWSYMGEEEGKIENGSMDNVIRLWESFLKKKLPFPYYRSP